MMVTPAIDAFVSYKREDRDRIAPLIAHLRESGLNVWWDVDIPGGSSWRPQIRQFLDDAKCIVVLWSERSVSPDAEFVHDEASVGHKRGVLLPIRIDDVSPPLGFGQVQCLDLVGWTGDSQDVRVAHVVDAVRARAAGSPAPPPPTPLRRRHWIAVGLTALPIIAVLADVSSLQPVLCTAPGIRWACGRLGIGGVPSPTEQVAWSSRPPGDCDWLRRFLSQHPTGAYSETAERLLQSRRTESIVSWSPEEQRVPVRVSPASGLAAAALARVDALERSQEQAALVCGGFAQGEYRLVQTRVADETIKWDCSSTSNGVRCGFDAMAVCNVEAKHTTVRETCE